MRTNRQFIIYTYIIANIVAAVLFLESKELDGDFYGYKVSSPNILINTLIMIIVSFLMIYFLIVMLDKINIGIGFIYRINLENGNMVFFLQICYIAFNLLEGVNIAGSTKKSDSPISLFFLILSPDNIFLCYLMLTEGFDDKKKINTIIYIISNIMRGWMGFWLFLVFYIIGNWKIVFPRKKNIIIYVMIFILLLPISYSFKWIVRGADEYDLISIKRAIGSNNTNTIELVTPLIMRMQQLSDNYKFIENKSELRDILGQSRPYYKENAFSYLVDRIFHRDRGISAGVILFNYYRGKGQTGYQIGIPGYFEILGFPNNCIYVIYIVFLIFLFYLELQLIDGANSVMQIRNNDLLLVVSIVYICHGWLLAFSYMLLSLLNYLIICEMLSIYRKYALLRHNIKV